jgi:hypothetical protein
VVRRKQRRNHPKEPLKTKQTQFPGGPNERKCCFNKELRRKSATQSPKNKPNSNPIQSQFKPNTNPDPYYLKVAKMNVNKVLTKDYENIRLRRRGKNKPKQTQTNPNKPKQTQTNPNKPSALSVQSQHAQHR